MDFIAQGAQNYVNAVGRGIKLFFSFLTTPAFVLLLVMVFMMTFGSIVMCIRVRVTPGRLYSVCTGAALFSIWLARYLLQEYPQFFGQ